MHFSPGDFIVVIQLSIGKFSSSTINYKYFEGFYFKTKLNSHKVIVEKEQAWFILLLRYSVVLKKTKEVRLHL